MNVLIVEDDAIIGLLLQTEVERMGFRVSGPIATGRAAVARALELCPDIVLMDIRLRGDMDGIEAARQIKEISDPDLIFITAFSDASSINRIEPLEPAGYLLKPFTARNLFVTLSVCASNRGIRLERDQLTRDMTRLELLHSSVMENSPDGILCVGANGIVLTANDAATHIFERSTDQLVGEQLTALIPEEHQAVHDFVRQSTGDFAPGEPLFGCRGGARFAMSLSLSRFAYEGRPMCTAIVRDITDQLAQEDRRRQGEKLQAIGKFSASIAHDINNLLTVVVGAASLLPIVQHSPVFDEIVDELGLVGSRGSDLTKRLLLFARRDKNESVVVPVDTAIEDLLPLLKRLVGPTIRVELCLASAASVRLDQGEIEQVLVNLVANARDALPDGGVVHIHTELEHSGDRSTVHLQVRDNGVGMDIETQARCFSPFYTTKASGEGTGLGLQTVAEIVLRSGGSCAVSSELGRGTMFRFSLPSVAMVAQSSVRSPSPDTSSQNCGRVLIVDSDPGVLRLTSAVLQAQGFSTLSAPGALAALHLVESDPTCADVLLCEVQLPFMDGFEVAASIRRNSPGMAVVMTTSAIATRPEVQREAWSGVPMLSKPVAVQALVKAIRDVLSDG